MVGASLMESYSITHKFAKKNLESTRNANQSDVEISPKLTTPDMHNAFSPPGTGIRVSQIIPPIVERGSELGPVDACNEISL